MAHHRADRRRGGQDLASAPQQHGVRDAGSEGLRRCGVCHERRLRALSGRRLCQVARPIRRRSALLRSGALSLSRAPAA